MIDNCVWPCPPLTHQPAATTPRNPSRPGARGRRRGNGGSGCRRRSAGPTCKETLISARAAAGAEEPAEEALGRAYRTLLDRRPHQVLFQVQAHAAATADPVIRAPVRQRFMEIIELSERLHDAPREVVLRHVGRVMLGNVAVVLDLPPEFRPAG